MIPHEMPIFIPINEMLMYPQIDLSEWSQVGEGYNGQAFVSEKHPGKLLKMVRGDLGSLEKVEQEFYASRAALEAGLPTPKVLEMVRDGQEYGYISEMVKGKKSFSRLCADVPERIAEFAAQMARYGKELHAHPLKASEYVPSLKQLLREALASSPLVTEGHRSRLFSLVDGMADTPTCVHGDFQPGNIILAQGKHYWIDLGWLCVGDAVMDLAHLYKMMVEDSVIPSVQDLTHMSREQMLAFWDAFAREYTGREDIGALNQELRPYAALDIVRTFYLHTMEEPAFIAFLRRRITEELR